MNKNFKRDITEKNINDILDCIKKGGNTHKAIKDLKATGVIPSDVSDSCYKRRLQQQQKYLELMEFIKEEKVKYHQQVIELKDKGKSYKEINNITGINYHTIYSIIKNSKNKKSREVTGLTEQKAKTIVNWFYKNPLEGRFLTNETKQAFNLLGLKIPA
jgi:DNA invertase Pin-like site-specific DNA recombinase